MLWEIELNCMSWKCVENQYSVFVLKIPAAAVDCINEPFWSFAFNEMLHSTHICAPYFPCSLQRNVVFIELYTSSTFCTPDLLLFSFKASAGKSNRKKAVQNRYFYGIPPALALFFHKLIYPQQCKFERKDLLRLSTQ